MDFWLSSTPQKKSSPPVSCVIYVIFFPPLSEERLFVKIIFCYPLVCGKTWSTESGLTDSLTDRLIDVQTARQTDERVGWRSIDQLNNLLSFAGGLTDLRIDRQTHSLTKGLTDWLTQIRGLSFRQIDQLTESLTDRLTIKLADWLTDSPTDWRTDWHTDWLTDLRTDWLTQWLADW